MTMTGLPRRPYAELPPPVDGLSDVRAEAGRRRRRRLIGVTTGGVAVGTVAVAALLTLGGGGDFAVLKPVPPAGTLHSPNATAPPTPSTRDRDRPDDVNALVAPEGRGNDGAQASERGPVALGPLPAPASSQRAVAPPATAAAPAGPVLVRSRSTRVSTKPPVCEGATYDDSAGLSSSFGWCVSATTARAANGVRLMLEVCRDPTGGGSLSFRTSREADLAVMKGDQVIWNWAHDHPSTPYRHQLATAANGCWDWSLIWSGETNNGAAPPHGKLTLVATSTADETRGADSQSVQFSY